MKSVEHREIPRTLVKRLLEMKNNEERQLLFQTMNELMNCAPFENQVQVFIAPFPEATDTQEILQQFAVTALTEQLSYWQFYRENLRKNSLVEYLNIVSVLPVVNQKGRFSATVVSEQPDEYTDASSSYLLRASMAGDGDFWSDLANNKIKARLLLDPQYGSNHYPIIPISELGIEPDQVQDMVEAIHKFRGMITILFAKNIQLQVEERILPEAAYNAQLNSPSLGIALARYYKDFDKVDEVFEKFKRRFNDHVSEAEWTELLGYVDVMIAGFRRIITTAYAHT